MLKNSLSQSPLFYCPVRKVGSSLTTDPPASRNCGFSPVLHIREAIGNGSIKIRCRLSVYELIEMSVPFHRFAFVFCGSLP